MSNKDTIPVEVEPPETGDPDTDIACRDVGLEERSLLAKVMDRIAEYCRSRSLFILHYCTGCGAIELPPTMTSRFDMERLGVSPMVTPRQADVLLITGYLSVKTLKRVIMTYEQMQGPKYLIGLGSCTINGGMYWNSYATIKLLDRYLPVDLYIAGCMPRPEAILECFQTLMKRIDNGEAQAWKDYYRRYDYYLGQQQQLFGDDWLTPTDVVGEAARYELCTEDTTGEYTMIMEESTVRHLHHNVNDVLLMEHRLLAPEPGDET